MELITFRFTDAGEQITLRLSDAARGPRGLQGEQGEVGPAGPSTTVVDALNSTSATSALSANQGRLLDERVDSLESALIDHATNAAKLAADTPRVGQKVRITGEANRIEEFLGGDSEDDANWLVLRNTVYLRVTSQDTTETIEINGVECEPLDADVIIGWVDPLKIGNHPGTSWRITKQYHDAFYAYDITTMMATEGYFPLPHPCPPRAEVWINVITVS
jgi:hypothetical protein